MALDTPAGLFSRIQSNLGRGSQTTVVALIPEWVNLTQRKLCREEKLWPCFAEDTTNTFAAGDDTASYPSDFLDEEYLVLKDSKGEFSELAYMDDLEYRDFYTDQTGSAYQSLPKHYLLKPDEILLRPIADDAYTLFLGYWKQLTDLTSGGASNDLLDTYPDLLESGGTYRGFRYMQQYEDALRWEEIYNNELLSTRIANANRELPGEWKLSVRPGGNRSRIRGRLRRLGGFGFGYFSRKGY